MNKVILFFALSLLMCVSAHAKCDDGYTVLGMNDNHAYCVSKAKMEWAFALDWCVHLQERQPATLEQACDGHNVVGDGACANLMVPKDHMLYGQSVLATNSYGSAEYRVVLGSGNIYNLNLLFEDRLFYALCY